MLLKLSHPTRQVHLPVWLRWLPVLAFAGLWELAPRLGLVDGTFLPPLSDVLGTEWVLLVRGQLLEHAATSLLRVIAGFAVALTLGVWGGVLLSRSSVFWRSVVDPFTRVLSQLNPFSLLPVFLLVFGSGEAVKVAALAWVATWPVLFFTTVGVTTADPLLMKTARSLGADERTLLWKVALPAAIPAIFVGLRIAAGLVFFVLIGAEMLGTNAGLGWLVHNSGMNYQVKGIYAGALAVIVIGFGFSRLLLRLEARVLAAFGDTFGPQPERRVQSLAAAGEGAKRANVVLAGQLEAS